MGDIKEKIEDVNISDAFKGELILHNDDHNDIEFIVSCLHNICNLSHIASLGVAARAHENQKSLIKKGVYEKLYQEKNILKLNGVTTSIK